MALDKGNFISNHYEKLILGVCLIGLILSVVFVVFRLIQPPEDPKSSIKIVPKEIAPVDVASFAVDAALSNRVALTNLALISELRLACTNNYCQKLIKEKAEACPFCGFPQPDPTKRDSDKDGMTDKYELAHGLDPLDPNDFYTDKDGDGFTNGEEFKQGTHPDNALSHAPFIDKVCIVKTENRPLKFRFQGVNTLDDSGTNVTFQLNLRTLDRTYFARMNEKVQGYEVVKYVFKKTTNQNQITRDVSVIHLDDGEEVLQMQIGKVVDKNRIRARLLNVLDPDQVILVKKNATFKLRENEFQVLQLSPRAALVKNIETGEEHTLPACSTDQKLEAKRRKEGLRPSEFEESMDFQPEGFPSRPAAKPRPMR